MPRLTLASLRSARVGAVFPDAAVSGLRYVRAPAGLYASLRLKLDGAWRTRGLGPVDIEQLRHDYVASRLDDVDEWDEERPSFSITLDDILEPVRKKARELRRQLLAGESPQGDGLTFGAVAAQFRERKVAKLAPRSQPEYERALSRFLPAWQHRPIRAITRADVVAELDKVADKHGPVAGNRAAATLGSLFTFALKRGAIDVSPALKLDRAKEEPRDRVFRDDELARLWAAFERLGYPWGDWGKLLCLTGQRREQVATMRWEHLEGLDGPAACWYARQKGDTPLLVPLAPMAAALLRSLRPTDAEAAGYVFTSRRGGAKAGGQSPIRGFTHAKGLALDVLARDGGPPLPDWRFHDVRRTVRTGLSRLRVEHHVAELVLGHNPFTAVQKAYNLHDYQGEKRAALLAWERHLAAVTGAGNVAAFDRARGAA